MFNLILIPKLCDSSLTVNFVTNLSSTRKPFHEDGKRPSADAACFLRLESRVPHFPQMHHAWLLGPL